MTKVRKARRKSKRRSGSRKSSGPTNGKSRKHKKKSGRARFKMNLSAHQFTDVRPYTMLENTKEFSLLYRSTGYNDSSCNHPFFGPSLESVKSYINPGVERTYVITEKKDKTPFILLNLDQNILNILSKRMEFKEFFPSGPTTNRVFIYSDYKWQRASDNSKLDCAFYNKLFELYPDAEGFYTEQGNTPAECVLNEKKKQNLSEMEMSYRGMGTPVRKKPISKPISSKGAVRKTLDFL